ncbi:molybdopterin-guanine dinucleotide biosynthesis protein B [Thiohalorhabdus methylotrophus]|uniref:Molybdopterin-guanine dinucleotide biosynthesis protein B n=1 Tax=Thiohalorhabdus methylotrophus TaxID=3242694 RepID=A0ABV4TTY0_9GAMM
MIGAFPKPVLGFVAYSGTGKTTLLTRLIPLLREAGLRVGLVKHAHHGFDPDIPGKDSYRLRKAGAAQTLVASPRRWALFTEEPEEGEAPLAAMLERLDPGRLDLVLVEGFRGEDIPKIEVHRPALGQPALYPELEGIIAVALDAPPELDFGNLPLLDINRPETVAACIQVEMREGRLRAGVFGEDPQC